MNALTNIPPNVRATLYWLSFIVGIGLGATQVGFQAAEAGFPIWLKVGLSVYAFLSGVLGLTAASNTPSYADVVGGDAEPPVQPPRNQGGAVDALTVVVIVLVVVLVLFLLGFLPAVHR